MLVYTARSPAPGPVLDDGASLALARRHGTPATRRLDKPVRGLVSKDIPVKNKLSFMVTASLLALSATPAFAASYGSVKVECGESCFDVVVGEVCDAYVQHSRPRAIACDDTATPGYGRSSKCGKGTCRSYGTLRQSDPVGAYCEAGHGYDAIVTCQYGALIDSDGEEVSDDEDPVPQDKVQSDNSPEPEPEPEDGEIEPAA